MNKGENIKFFFQQQQCLYRVPLRLEPVMAVEVKAFVVTTGSKDKGGGAFHTDIAISHKT